MTQAHEIDTWEDEAAELTRDDGDAAREHLAAGRPIAYRDEDTPLGHVIMRYPNGTRELVRVERDGDVVVGVLPPLG